MGRAAIYMVDILLPVLISTILGILAGLGVGGGSLLLQWLTAVAGTEYQLARMINLLFFLPSALAATIFRWKQGIIDINAIWPGILAGCISVFIGNFISNQIQLEVLKKLFGLLLIITGIKEILYRPRNAK